MIDRGSSGGPLVDLDGRVIGINSRGQGRGIGFTIPIDTALDVMAQLERRRHRARLARRHDPAARPRPRRLLRRPDVTGVIVNSVARRLAGRAGAGSRPGDVLTALRRHPVEAEKEEDLGSFQRLVARVAARHSTVKLELLRGGSAQTVTIELGDAAEGRARRGRERRSASTCRRSPRTCTARERLATREGAYVSFVASGSPAAEAGLEPGDVVVRMGESRVSGPRRVPPRERGGGRRRARPAPRAARQRPPLPAGEARREERTRERAPERSRRRLASRLRSRQSASSEAPSAGWTVQSGGSRPWRAAKPVRIARATSSAASGSTRCSVQPPKPAPVRREP